MDLIHDLVKRELDPEAKLSDDPKATIYLRFKAENLRWTLSHSPGISSLYFTVQNDHDRWEIYVSDMSKRISSDKQCRMILEILKQGIDHISKGELQKFLSSRGQLSRQIFAAQFGDLLRRAADSNWQTRATTEPRIRTEISIIFLVQDGDNTFPFFLCFWRISWAFSKLEITTRSWNRITDIFIRVVTILFRYFAFEIALSNKIISPSDGHSWKHVLVSWNAANLYFHIKKIGFTRKLCKKYQRTPAKKKTPSRFLAQ